MNVIRFLGLFCLFILAGISFSTENEFVVVKKEKMFYPSRQQCVEIDGEITNDANSAMKFLVDLQRAALAEINLHIDGDKECVLQRANKHQRAKLYRYKVSIRDGLRDIVDRLSKLSELQLRANSISI